MPKIYYIDPSSRTNGDGTINKPFNSLNEIVKQPYPYTALIKRGTVERVSITLPSMTGQVERTTIGSYGSGIRPVLLPKSAGSPIITSTLVKHLLITDIDLTIDLFSYTSENAIFLRADSEGVGNNVADVGITNVDVIYQTTVVTKTKAFFIDAIGGANLTYSNDDLYIKNCNVYGGHWAAQINGGGAYYSINGGDTYRAKRMLIDNCSHIDGVGDSWMAMRANGEGKACITNCYSKSSAYRTDTSIYTAAIWMYGCENTGIEYCEVAGTLPNRYDKMGFDIDGNNKDVWVRYCYSHNNAGGFIMFADAESKGKNFASLAEAEQFLITEQHGIQNCVFEYCLSYNDGVARGGYGGRWPKITLVSNPVNCAVRNCTIIDTISKTDLHLVELLEYYYEPIWKKYPMVMENNVFYFKYPRYREGSGPPGEIGYGNFKNIIWRNNIFWTETGDPRDWNPRSGTVVNSIFTDPKLSYLTDVPPSGLEAAKLIKLLTGSAALNSGTTNSLPDILGNRGNNIGWLQ
ncbi:pectin lyase [Serratia phage vB_SmaS-Totoro]|nr:pectin lyase [Serratia phage vB_SmaS-Totoro]